MKCTPSSNCNPNPCQNDGICTDKDDSYTCNCTDNYTGVNCSTITKSDDGIYLAESTESTYTSYYSYTYPILHNSKIYTYRSAQHKEYEASLVDNNGVIK